MSRALLAVAAALCSLGAGTRTAPVVYFHSTFEDGTLGDLGIFPGINGTCRVTTAVARSGTHAAECMTTASGAGEGALWYVWGQKPGEPANPALAEPTGVYQMFSVRYAPGSLANVRNGGSNAQFKLLLNRSDWHFGFEGGWFMTSWGVNYGTWPPLLLNNGDDCAGLNWRWPFPLQEGVWYDITTWFKRDGTTHMGHAKLWVNGALVTDTDIMAPAFDVPHPGGLSCLGSDHAANAQEFEVGATYTQNTVGSVTVYVDDVEAANFPIGAAAGTSPVPVGLAPAAPTNVTLRVLRSTVTPDTDVVAVTWTLPPGTVQYVHTRLVAGPTALPAVGADVDSAFAYHQFGGARTADTFAVVIPPTLPRAFPGKVVVRVGDATGPSPWATSGVVCFSRGGTSCSAPNPPPPPPPPPPPAAVAHLTLDPSLDTLFVGQRVQLVAVPTDTAGRLIPGALVTWGNRTPGIISVSPTGLVGALAPGFGQPTATVPPLTSTGGIVVLAPGPAQVTLGPTGLAWSAGSSVRLFAIVTDVLGTRLPDAVTWSSGNLPVATVDTTGLVTGVSPGVAMIRARAGRVGDSTLVSILPPPAPSPIVWSIRRGFLQGAPRFWHPACVIDVTPGVTTTCGGSTGYAVSDDSTGALVGHLVITFEVRP